MLRIIKQKKIQFDIKITHILMIFGIFNEKIEKINYSCKSIFIF